jgi:hypothetical protein
MDFTATIVRGLVLAVALGGLAACTQESAPPVTDATAGFCVGIDKAHPANGRATVTFKRGNETLGTVSNVVTGPVAVSVTPGQVTVYVDATAAVTLTASAGNSAYATSGTGCPATLSP